MVDSYRYLSNIMKRLVKTWIQMEEPSDIPWTPLSKPLCECTIALVSSGGIALKTDEPFDQNGERQNPWWGDPSFRILPSTTRTENIEVYHLHINPENTKQDMNCLLPIERLHELAASGEIGFCAPSHYSIMGYILDPKELLNKTTPAIIHRLKDEKVDIVILIPV